MQPLEDVNVVDFTQSVAGPICTQILGVFGSNIVKIEPPNGDDFRDLHGGSIFCSYNLGGKRSLPIDLKTEEGRGLARELVESADVVVENFRPGTMSKFGLDYETVSERNEDVVYCSISGFGQDGPYHNEPAYDPIIQAMSSLMSVIGYPDRLPVRIGTSVIDCSTGTNAALMVFAALQERAQSGEGAHIDVSLYETAVSWMAYWIANYDETGEVVTRTGTGFPGSAPNEVFSPGDDEPFYLCGINQKVYERICKAVERPDLLDDPRFETMSDRWEHRELLRAELEETFAEYTRDELMEIFSEWKVPAGPVYDVSDVVEDSHVQDRNLLISTKNINTGEETRTVRLPLRTVDWIPEHGSGPPRFGEEVKQILSEHGYTEQEIDQFIDDGVVFKEPVS